MRRLMPYLTVFADSDSTLVFWAGLVMDSIYHEKVGYKCVYRTYMYGVYKLAVLFYDVTHTHIQQEGQLCAQHCLNNLLQGIK